MGFYTLYHRLASKDAHGNANVNANRGLCMDGKLQTYAVQTPEYSIGCYKGDESSSKNMLAASVRRDLFDPKTGRVYLSDRRHWVDQLKPRNMAVTCVRLSALQLGQITAGYYNDLLDETMRLDRKVMDMDDPMTREQADMLERIWSETEWSRRFDFTSISMKIKESIITAQLTSLVVRGLESIVVANCTVQVADSYIIDPFKEAKRKFERDYDSTGENGGKTKGDIGKEMAVVCLRANAIAFFAEYIVSQFRLAYSTFYKNYSKSDKEEQMKLFLKASSTLAFSRMLGLLASCAGACVGTLVLPPGGYGTLLGSNIGDSLVANLIK